MGFLIHKTDLWRPANGKIKRMKKAHEKRIKTLKCKKWNDSDLILRTWTLLLLSAFFYSPILLSQTAQNIKRLGITSKNVYSIFFCFRLLWMGSPLFTHSFPFIWLLLCYCCRSLVFFLVRYALLFDGWTEKFPPHNSIGIKFFTFFTYIYLMRILFALVLALAHSSRQFRSSISVFDDFTMK